MNNDPTWCDQLYFLLGAEPSTAQASLRHERALKSLLEDPQVFDALEHAPPDVWESLTDVTAGLVGAVYAQQGHIPVGMIEALDRVQDTDTWINVVQRWSSQSNAADTEQGWASLQDQVQASMYHDPAHGWKKWVVCMQLLSPQDQVQSFQSLHPHAQAFLATRLEECPADISCNLKEHIFAARLYALLDEHVLNLGALQSLGQEWKEKDASSIEKMKSSLQDQMSRLDSEAFAQVQQCFSHLPRQVTTLLYPVEQWSYRLPMSPTAQQHAWIKMLSNADLSIRSTLLNDWLHEVAFPIGSRDRLPQVLDVLALCVQKNWHQDAPPLAPVSPEDLLQTFINWGALPTELAKVNHQHLNTLSAFPPQYGVCLSAIAQLHGQEFLGFFGALPLDKQGQSQFPKLWKEFVAIIEHRDLAKEVNSSPSPSIKKKM